MKRVLAVGVPALALAASLAIIAQPAEAAPPYSVVQRYEYGAGGSHGSYTTYCNYPDFAVSYTISSKSGPAKLSSAMFFGSRTGNGATTSEEGVVVEYRNKSTTKGGAFTVTLVCELD
jgi:hypothetical protein